LTNLLTYILCGKISIDSGSSKFSHQVLDNSSTLLIT